MVKAAISPLRKSRPLEFQRAAGTGAVYMINKNAKQFAGSVLIIIGCVLCLSTCRASLSPPNTPPGMDPYSKDLIDTIAKGLGLITVIGGAIGVIIQIRKYRADAEKEFLERVSEAEKEYEARRKEQEDRAEADRLRREDLRWRKAGLARQIINEFLDDESAGSAMQMLDWSGRTFTQEGTTFTVSHPDMYQALRTDNLKFEKKEQFIRDCFDSFFVHQQLTEHYLRIGLLEFDDIRYPHSYYAELMTRNKNVFGQFLLEYKYDYALSFLHRFPSWATGKTSTVGPSTPPPHIKEN